MKLTLVALILVSLTACATGSRIALERPDGKTELDSEIDANVCNNATGSTSEYLFCMRRLGYRVVQIPR